jgi:hypothetical protein
MKSQQALEESSKQPAHTKAKTGFWESGKSVEIDISTSFLFTIY